MNVMYQNKNLHTMKGYELMVIITGTAYTGWLSSTKCKIFYVHEY